jgi:hypothetical protein
MRAVCRRARREAAIAGARNLIIRKLAMMWTAIGALLADDGPDASGWARTDDEGSEHGLVRVIVLKGRKLVREGMASADAHNRRQPKSGSRSPILAVLHNHG